MQTIPFVPENAPFTPEQRSWLNGFLAGIYSAQPVAAAAAEPPHSLKIAVLYASQSGTSEGIARKVAKDLKARGHVASLLSLEGYTPKALLAESYAIIIASTYGEGEAPDAVRPFYEELCLEHFPCCQNLSYCSPRARRLYLRALLQIRHRPRQQAVLARRHPPLRPYRLRRRSRRELHPVEDLALCPPRRHHRRTPHRLLALYLYTHTCRTKACTDPHPRQPLSSPNSSTSALSPKMSHPSSPSTLLSTSAAPASRTKPATHAASFPRTTLASSKRFSTH